MTFAINKPINITAFAIATVAFTVLHGSMLMGFEKLAKNGQPGVNASTQVAKRQVAPRTVDLDRVVISTHRV